MNVDEIVKDINARILLLNHKLYYDGKKKTKREESVLSGKIGELESLLSFIEYRTKQETVR